MSLSLVRPGFYRRNFACFVSPIPRGRIGLFLAGRKKPEAPSGEPRGGPFHACVRITVLGDEKINRPRRNKLLLFVSPFLVIRAAFHSRLSPRRGGTSHQSRAKHPPVLGDKRLERLRGRSPDLLNDVGLRVELAALVGLRHTGEMLDQVRRQLKLRQNLRPSLDRQIDILHPLVEHAPEDRRHLVHGQ